MSEKIQNRKLVDGTLLTVIMISMLGGGNSSYNVLLNSLAKAFPNASSFEINMTSVLPYVFGIFIPVLLGTFVGRKVGYRPVLIISCILYLIGTVGPVFFHSSYGTLLLFRAIFGVGIAGISVRMAFIIVYYKELEVRSKVLGWVMFAMNGAAIVWSIASGYLAEINVFYAFAVYLIAIIPLLLCIFAFDDPFKKSDNQEASNADQAQASSVKQKGKFRPITWVYLIGNGLMMLLQFQFQLAISSWISMNNLGSAATAGYIISAFTVGGLAGGVFFYKIIMSTKRYSFLIVASLFCVGMALVYFTRSVILFGVGGALIGLATTGGSIVLKLCFGDTTDSTTINMASGICSAMGYAGMFFSAFAYSLFGKIAGAVGGPMLCSTIAFGIFAVLFIFINPLPRETRERFANEV